MRKMILLSWAVSAAVVAPHAQSPQGRAPLALPKQPPTVDQILSLERAGSPEISPDGRFVAYTVRTANWDDNAYDAQIWLADARAGRAPRPLTNSKKSSTSPAWSPDGSRLAFGSDRTDKRQIYLINPLGGEAEAITTLEDGVGSFAWSPDGKSIAFTSTDPKSAALKDRDKKYGEFQVVEQDYRMSHLSILDVEKKTTKPLTSGAFTVGRFAWSPDGTTIAFDHTINNSPASSGSGDISIVTVATGSIRKLVTQDGPDSHPVWSPDGATIAFETAMANPAYFYTNRVIATVPASGGAPTPLTASFDEDPSIADWSRAGLFFSASQKTSAGLFRLDPATKTAARVGAPGNAVQSSFSFTRDGSKIAYLSSDATAMSEVFTAGSGFTDARKLTDFNAQTRNWAASTLDVVSWKSQDGAAIEGVLHKPADFDAAKKYPLLVVIHGGPTGISRAIPFTSMIYPIDVWVTRGVLVLEPNYRGSAGYGEKFRSLNVKNLGVGDAWDVLSGVDSLIAKGMVDRDRVGVMGWSQGGYISAFLATHDAARFKAISVGAGISDWMTYYVNTDIHPFTRQYLQATPWDDAAIYSKTSPITYIKQAKTPTLIQHGATDQRVPLPNAFELYQGLKDNDVPTKLIVYQGFGGIGHGPSKPKSYRATMEHNLEWFDQWMFKP
ncbi:MAG TPA: S9 family peptidase, partial [Vicinamibacterales bacterium]|nr:S9 family peptidase [Vicinamibacterales bacterium]